MTSEVMTSLAPGNTNTGAARVYKARSYLFTLNEPSKYELLKNHLTGLKTLTYLISAREYAPTTGHEHIHIYAHFSEQYRLSKKIISTGVHIDKCRGSPKQCIEYVRKDGNIIDEIGEIVHQGCKSVQELRETPMDQCDPHLYRIKKEIDDEQREMDIFMNMLTEIENDNLQAPEIVYVTGCTGAGKTYTGYKYALSVERKDKIGKLQLKSDFVKIINKNADTFVIEEFRPSQMHAADFLQLTDKYGYSCNVKGGFYTIRPKRIIICSIIPPEDIYHDEVNEQFLRRITKRVDLGGKSWNEL